MKFSRPLFLQFLNKGAWTRQTFYQTPNVVSEENNELDQYIFDNFSTEVIIYLPHDDLSMTLNSKIHSKQYCVFFRVALRFLSISASSAAPERLFSPVYNIITPNLNWLGDYINGYITFLKSMLEDLLWGDFQKESSTSLINEDNMEICWTQRNFQI